MQMFAKFDFWPLIRSLRPEKDRKAETMQKPMKIGSYRPFSIRNRMSLLILAKFHFWPLLRPLEARKGTEILKSFKTYENRVI